MLIPWAYYAILNFIQPELMGSGFLRFFRIRRDDYEIQK